MPDPIPLHPEATDDPRTVRWSIPVGLLPVAGTPAHVPAPLRGLLEDGTLARIEVQAGGVRTTLARADWSVAGPLVRRALAAALARPEQWAAPEPAGSGGPSTDELLLTSAVRQVIAGEVGDYVRSHGGSARLVEVSGNRATIVLDGACAHCPARGSTLQDRFVRAVRALYPGLDRLSLQETARRPVFRPAVPHR